MTTGNAFYTVSGLTLLLKTIIDEVPALHRIWVRGEVTNFTHHASGHMYFTLKDAGARLRCVMFRGQNRELRFHPQEGLEILAYGSLSVYERNGDYQLYVEALEPAGLGSQHLAFAQLRERLAKEGLFDAARKRPLPPFPRRIALVTSPSGAAVRDMIEILRQRRPGLDILIVPALVQGQDASASIAAGLAQASGLDGIDLVIVGRGGGSPEELWPFNEECVARAIANCRHPVISAVGHEVDVTIADLVADRRAATPSAAAEMAVPDSRESLRAVEGFRRRLTAAGRRQLALERAALARLSASPVLIRPERLLAGPRQALDEARGELARASRLGLSVARERLGLRAAALDSLSPLATLSRGYAICRREDGGIIHHAGLVELGARVEVLLRYGRLRCEVREREEPDDRGDCQEDL